MAKTFGFIHKNGKNFRFHSKEWQKLSVLFIRMAKTFGFIHSDEWAIVKLVNNGTSA